MIFLNILNFVFSRYKKNCTF